MSFFGWGSSSSSSNVSVDADEANPDDSDPELPEPSTPHTYTDNRLSVLAQRKSVLPPLNNAAWGGWTEDDLQAIVIRGAAYREDKVKIDCGPALFHLAHTDVFYTEKGEERVTTVGGRDDQYIAAKFRAKAALPEWANDPVAATFIINIVFPAGNNITMNLVQYYERRVPPYTTLMKMKRRAAATSANGNNFGDELLVGVDAGRVKAFDTLYTRFINGTDSFRDSRLKIIPRVVEGSFIIKTAVGRVPAILGKKIKQSYSRDVTKNYFEVSADLGTSSVAGRLISLIRPTCKSIVMDMSFLLQGDADDELPESLIGGIRIDHCDMGAIEHFELNKKHASYHFSHGNNFNSHSSAEPHTPT